MRKYPAAVLLITVLVFSCVACKRNSDSKNFLGGYGEITQGAYTNSYISAFFEDDIYIYFDNYKINKQSGQWMNLCDLPGCMHDNPECPAYKYRNKIFPGYGRIFYIEERKLYELTEDGDTTYIASFDTDSHGIFLSENINIECVKPLNRNVVYIMCQGGSCLYNTQTDDKIYTSAYMCCADDKNIYYYDTDLNGILQVNSDTMQSQFLENTERIYPCFCSDDKLYCNTETGIICRIDRMGNIEVCLAEEGMRYTLLGIHNGRLYYLLADTDILSGEYTSCDLYSSMPDGTVPEKIDAQNLKPDMSSFFCEDALYLLDTGKFGGIKSFFTYNFNTKTGNTYILEHNENNESDILNTEVTAAANANPGEMQPKKSFAMATNFYTEVTDTLTGNKSRISQKTVPFKADGSKLKTTFYYTVDVEGYPSDGYIYVFVMCDGILQKLSVNGNAQELINKVEYSNKKDMYAELEFLLENSSDNQEIVIGYYLSDSIITDDFDIFGDYKETISYTKFTYELQDGYVLASKVIPKICAGEAFNNVYTYEAQEKYEDIVNTSFALISDRLPIGQQKERWSLQFESDSTCHIVLHSQSGSYAIYLLIDDKPVPVFEGETCINCDINGEYDTAVLDISINDIVRDEEKHTAKLMIYDKQAGDVKLYPAQIVQKKD